MTDYYQVLGIKQSATATEIKSAYRKLARKRHPDVNRGSEKSAREFALLSLAYHTLIDPQERAFHDQQLINQRNGTLLLLLPFFIRTIPMRSGLAPHSRVGTVL